MLARRYAAIVLQLLSFLATLAAMRAAAAYLAGPSFAGPREWIVASLLALFLEALFVALKEATFAPGMPAKLVGVTLGFLPDGLINTGGVMIFALAILTFRPVAAILGLAEIDLANPDETLTLSLVVSLLAGFGLSIAPHILWREWGRRPKAKTA